MLNDLSRAKDIILKLKSSKKLSIAEKIKIVEDLRTIIVTTEEILSEGLDKSAMKSFIAYINTLEDTLRKDPSKFDSTTLNIHLDQVTRFGVRLKKETIDGR